ncbi:MAG TPA: PQQ-binding-like beta-propeller repeat protein [Iamia sp.]|nr:PQQ-binding-like beta-propeller repeat protein [Iamia sp.]
MANGSNGSNGWAPEPDEDVGALAAVWGREATATAVPQSRRPADPARRSGPPRRRLLLVAGATVVVVVAIAVAVVVVGGGDGDRATGPSEAPSSDRVASTTVPPWEPGWTTEVTCPRLEVTAELRTSACPLATDDERAYVLEAPDAPAADDPVVTVVALGVADGQPVWAVAFLDGAREVLRYPSTVLVVGPDQTSAVDPIVGEVRWTAPGVPVAPLGRDHLLLGRDTDDGAGGVATTMTVVAAGTGVATFSRAGPAPTLAVHPCAAAGLVLVSDGERLTAHDVGDGAERWSVAAQHHDGSDPIVCTADLAVEVQQDGRLLARDARTGAVVATASAAVPTDEGFASIVEMVDETVVVATDDQLAGFAADASLAPLWTLDLPAGGREAVVGPAGGGGVAVAVPSDRAASFGPDGAVGEQMSLEGRADAVIEGDRLVAWGAEDALVAPASDLGRARRLPLADVRRAAVGSTHVVVSTRDEVRLYPFDP